MATVPALFRPLTIGSVTFPNRLWVAPMCMYSATQPGALVGPWHQAHYGSLAAGGAGLVLLEATAVAPEGRINLADLGIWTDSQVAGLRGLVDFIHGQGAVAGIQLGHAGRKASATVTATALNNQTSPGALAPSAIAFGDYSRPTEMTQKQIRQVQAAFSDAATRAVKAGFDLVEIHAAHGYLLHQFASPLSNTRQDDYGGSLDNRLRLLLQVVQAVRDTLPSNVVLAMRISATDWVDGGWDVDQSIELVTKAKALGLDLLDVSAGGLLPDIKVPAAPGYLAPMAAQIKQATGVPTNTVGLIDNAKLANRLVSDGVVDAVMVGRGLLRNPHLPIAWATELGLDPDLISPPQYQRARWGQDYGGLAGSGPP
ncbi:MAG: NADH:flavin oxidoreductase/NADH oxidase, partial [Micrococcales bacterium]|nr:NADH:flavin oxidoreductase/NADH oxidase [Micrococcales bacterium]